MSDIEKELERLRSENNRLKKYDEERDMRLHARLIQETAEETARKIFADIDTLIGTLVVPQITAQGQVLHKVAAVTLDELAYKELKKKYKVKEFT